MNGENCSLFANRDYNVSSLTLILRCEGYCEGTWKVCLPSSSMVGVFDTSTQKVEFQYLVFGGILKVSLYQCWEVTF